MTVIKPYWVNGDSRILQFTGEVSYFQKDSLISTDKAKWEGATEVVAADGKTFSVSIVESIVDNKITYNDLLADVEAPQENTDYVFKMDKTGKVLGIDNFDDVKALYIANKEKDLKAEKGKISKEEKQLFVDSLTQALMKGDMFKLSIQAYVRNFYDIYGKMIPKDTARVSNMTEVNTKRYFAAATKGVDANQTLYISEVKGPKFTLNEILEYSYPGMQDFLVGIKVKDPVFEDNTQVRDHIMTVYDSKLGWPQKITEELVITNGKYKVVYKWSVKFAKEK